MFQRFNTNTLMSTYIKNLLNTTPVPVYSVLSNGQYMYEGHKYIYKGYVIRCIKSGILDSTDLERGVYPSDNIYPSQLRFPGVGITVSIARYQVISYYKQPQDTTPYAHTIRSKTNTYDSDTHEQFGRYLRYLRDIEGINLLRYYNYFSNRFTDNLYIDPRTNLLTEGKNSKYKVTLIPIKFNTTYSLAIDCDTLIYYTPVIIDNTHNLIKQTRPYEYNPTENLSDHKVYTHHNCKFLEPITLNIREDQPRLLNFEDQLRLLVQYPLTNNSSIVLMEGNYNNTHTYKCDSNHVLIPEFVSTPALLRFNCKTSFAFSDKLCEYLLDNVIHSGTTNSGNISRVQQMVSKIDTPYGLKYKNSLLNKGSIKGVWDSKPNDTTNDLLTNTLINFLNDKRNVIDNYDYSCDVDSKLENLLYKETNR